MHPLIPVLRLLVIPALCLLLLACGKGGEASLTAAQAAYKDADYPKAREISLEILKVHPDEAQAHLLLARIAERTQAWDEALVHYEAASGDTAIASEALFKAGQLYLLKRDAEALRKVVDRISGAQPDSADGLALAAGLLSLQGATSEAIEQARGVLESAPGHVNASTLLAALLVREGEADEALSLLERAADAHPDDTALTGLLARLYLQRGKTEQAEKLLEALVRAEPKVLPHRMELARLREARGDIKAAGAALEAAVEAIPPPHSAAAAARLTLIDFLQRTAGAKPALERLTRMVAEAPEDQELRAGLARFHELLGQPAEAALIYEELLAHEPDRKTPRALVALTRLAATKALGGDVDGASVLIEEVLASAPHDPEALLLRGTLAMERNDPAAAVTDLELALSAAPRATRIVRALARAHQANGDDDAADRVLEEAIAADPAQTELRMEMANLRLRENDPEAAFAALEAALEQSPKAQEILEAMYRLRMSQKDWQAAHKVCDRLKSALPESPLGFYLDGLTYQAEGKPAESLEQFESALTLGPDTIQPLSQVIRTHLAMGNRALAERRLEEAIDLNPDNFVAHNLAGELKFANEDAAGARASFERALAINPGVDILYRNLATAEIALGEEAEALAVLERGLEATGGSALLLTSLAGRLEATGKLDEAIARYEALLEKDPGSDLALNNLAMLLVEYRADAGGIAKAAELVGRITAREQPGFLDTIGWVAYQEGDDARAVEALKRAAEGLPDAPMVHYHLGMALLRQGDEVGARAALARALEGGAEYRGRADAEKALHRLEKTQ